MALIVVLVFAVLLAVVLTAVDGRLNRGDKVRFTDRDADGEPDEPTGPAAGA